MAKKKPRRARRRRAVRAASRPAAVSTPTGREWVEVAGPTRATAMDFAEQYGYVYDDLKRIAVLAGMMFAILFVLWFVIG
jgi:hypothetical protein